MKSLFMSSLLLFICTGCNYFSALWQDDAPPLHILNQTIDAVGHTPPMPPVPSNLVMA